jgi:Cu-Zn family superoxide dismutase
MQSLFLFSRRPLLPSLLALLLLIALPACSTTEEATEDAGDMAAEAVEETGDAANEAAEATAGAAEEVGEEVGPVAEGAWDTVTDAAGSAWNSVADLFDDDPETDAAALIRPTSGNSAQGTVKFYESDEGLRATVSLRDATPGPHGFHIHQNPSCADDAQAAGGHWDPHNTNDHGSPDENMSDRHAGDLGNVEVGVDGTVETTIMVPTYDPDEHDLDDLAVVLHSGRDDLETDPAGDSGSRIACGVIESR